MDISAIINVFEQYPVVWLLSILLFSLLVGSFLNVVIYRLPVMLENAWRSECEILLELPSQRPITDKNAALTQDAQTQCAETKHETFNLIIPNSHCQNCKRPIKPWFNIPILGWLMLQGKCANCAQKISARYPLIEALTGALGLVAAWQFGVSSETLWALIFTYFLICMCFIDFDTMLLPDQLTLPLLWLGLLANLNSTFVALDDAVLGALFGYLSLWLVFQLFKLVTGKEGMGYGDFKLLAALGAWMGWQSLLVIILISSIVGAVLGIVLLKLRNQDQQQPIPFGPFLVIAGWIAFYWRTDIIDFYLKHWVA
ncbi:prepilin peptidase [Catenovulum sediminis]|uniref:prepilin peptidase n=1 Tax=Catenovulum sediminis TaxID=1740262 RepID=UPI00117C777D|nr:A24 family peptidase [Catenovulum sediminis]